MNARQASGHSFEKSSMSMSPKVVSRTTLPDVGGSKEYTPDISFFYSRAAFFNVFFSMHQSESSCCASENARRNSDRYNKMESKNERIFGATQTRDVTLCARGECDVQSKEEEEEKDKDKDKDIAFILLPRALAPKPVLNAP